jgi:Tfp pilus assembly protein PilV
MRQRAGLSLSEVILALAILVIAVIAIASFVATVYKSVKEGKYQAVASTIAESELERLRVDQTALRDLIARASYGIKEQTVPVDATQVTYRQRVTAEVLPSMGNRYVKLVSRVTWRQSSRDREVVLESCYPKPLDLTGP